MRLLIIIVVLVALGVVTVARWSEDDVPVFVPQGEVPVLAGLGWVAVLNEEFDEPALDETIWEVHTGPGRSGPGTYTRDAVRIDDGALTITTYSQDADSDGELEHYTGELRTGSREGGAGFIGTYGYIEARIKLHNAPATRSAFWMLSQTWHRAPWKDPAAAGPELDIFEIGDPDAGDAAPADGQCDWQPLPLPCDRIAVSNAHWGGFEEDHVSARQVTPWAGASPQGNFVTYGLLWTPDGYRMYRDGVEVYHGTEAVTYHPEHLILTQHQGPSLPGDVPEEGYGTLSDSTTKMTVDYVRWWQPPISDVPDQVVGAGAALSVPLWVTDYVSSSTSAHNVADPLGSVRVTASSSNQSLVPDEHMVVTGNGPAQPSGSFTNGSFASGATGWTLAGDANVRDDGRSHGGGTLRLGRTGGRAEQTITGLRPNMTYAVDSLHHVELEWDDTNGNGRVDDGEPMTDDGARARFDWGITDADASRDGDQRVEGTVGRDGRREADDHWTVDRGAWHSDRLMFATGPDTTDVTVYVDNTAHASGDWSSNVSVDALRLRPVVPPNRTITMRSRPGVSGEATVTLTAVDANDRVLGTEDFTVTVPGSSFANGGFEASPHLRAIGQLAMMSSSTSAVAFDAPGVTITDVRSSNQHLLPDGSVAIAGTGDAHVLSLTPVPDRAGKATVTIGYTDRSGAHTHDLPVVVSDRRLVDGGFERAGTGWSLPATATVQTAVTRSGDAALQVDGATPGGPPRQLVAGLHHNTNYVLEGWSRGRVNVTVRIVQDPSMAPPESFTREFTAEWGGSGWTENQLRLTTSACKGCGARGSHARAGDAAGTQVPGGQIEVIVEDAAPDDGEPVYVDDLTLIHAPEISPLRELSLHHGHTEFSSSVRREFDVGHVHANSIWDPTTVRISSSDTDVLPLTNVRLVQPDARQPHHWGIEARTDAERKTGRSTVRVELTDPSTGISTNRTFQVTVNAGDNFAAGDFQRGDGLAGWSHAWFNDSAEVVEKQRWGYLAGYDPLNTLVGLDHDDAIGPNDADKVLRISSGVVGYLVTGLEPGTAYVVQASAMGSGSSVVVKGRDPACTSAGCDAVSGPLRGEVTIDSQQWAPTPELRFTTAAGETEVWIFVADTDVGDAADAVPASDRACALYEPGETCIDNIGLFNASTPPIP